MFKRGNIMWKLRWVKIVALMIDPCRWLTVAISLSLPILSSEYLQPIHSNRVLVIQ